MPILLDAPADASSGLPAFSDTGRPCLDIGLLNNMPDAAVLATEQQFIGLLAAAAGGLSVRLHRFNLPSIGRIGAARVHVERCYAGLDRLFASQLDALVVTGAEPRAAALADEPYWHELTQVVDWAEHNTRSTIWSCLAAHAAVLHLDGIARRPLKRKLSGVYACAAADHVLTKDMPAPLLVPHSRWNDLAESELATHGYSIVTRSPDIGVDIFVKRWRSAFVFLQGHPEYAADSLAREYRRDVQRFIRGEQKTYPTLPAGVFDAEGERTLLAFRAAARRNGAADLRFPQEVMPSSHAVAAWDASARMLYRNWLGSLAEQSRQAA